jgi:hypothetical protein
MGHKELDLYILYREFVKRGGLGMVRFCMFSCCFVRLKIGVRGVMVVVDFLSSLLSNSLELSLVFSLYLL